MTRLGVLAIGDSITNGGGELQWGVALQSWALWTARGLGMPYTGYAVDGAVVDEVVDLQIPAFLDRARDPSGPYDVGCLYIGVNDVRRPAWDPDWDGDWDADRFAANHARAVAFLAERCARTLCVTAPLRLGRPATPVGRMRALNDIVVANAREHGSLVVDLTDFGARNQLMVDHVHPTAFGQVAIAQRALRVLAGDGLDVRVDPATLIAYERTRSGAVRGDATYVYRDLKQRGRAWRVRRRAG